MSVTIDPKDPVASLEYAGVECMQCDTPSSTSFSVYGKRLHASTSVGMHYEWLLPEPISLHASFTRERFRDRLAGIFKRELRTGDRVFDKTVHVSTEDKDNTSYFLMPDACRDAISNLIVEGGRVTIDHDRLIFEVPGSATRRQLYGMAHMAAAIMTL